MATVELTATKPELITGEVLAEMEDIGPHELVEGRIVPMSPTGNRHGEIEINIGAELRAFVRSHKLGRVQVGEVGIFTRRDPDTVRAADILFISNERYAQQQSSGFLTVAPDLIVEILSTSDRWTDVTQKLREYFDIGVRLVWIVDPEAQRIYAYRSLTEVQEFTEKDELSGDEVLPGFSAPVAELFEI
jgi:Uma2 family endonuclease